MTDHDSQDAETWSRELTTCPDCGAAVEYERPGLETDGHGEAMAVIQCMDCEFQATEEWSIDRTVRET